MDLDLVKWVGASGREHEFWVYRLNQSFDEIAAVFLFVKVIDSATSEIVYVNQTNRMDLVGSNPIADEIINDYKPTEMHILINNELSERKGLMADILLKYNPVGNRRS